MKRMLRFGLAWLVGVHAVLATAQSKDVVINELMTSNGESIFDENGDSPDWFELLNASSAPVNLSGWGVSDDRNRPFKWVFENATLQPGEFMVVFASGKDRQPGAVSSLAPTNLAGLRLWLRADAVNTNDTAQVRRVGSDMFIRQWNDQSGCGNHAVQPDVTRQPT
ncbi:MAG: lamin tail domain-containing protein, partial [Verrucomicrobiota bacterium]|nr:lamin tail domain-containing protein [Verrucomicrobiota bacterium]